jgi:hypothetical protein
MFVCGIGSFWWVTTTWPFWLRVPTTAAVTILLLAYVVGFYSDSGSTTPWSGLAKGSETSLRLDDLTHVDSNDEQIIRMETSVLSLTQRIESYTLESTLFGALAFSGFLAILGYNRPILSAMRAIMQVLTNLPYLGIEQTGTILVSAHSQDTLWAAVALQTLFCSMFFLAVIVSRLRFYEIIRQVEYAVRQARAWNDKEEEVYVLTLHSPNEALVERLQQLTNLVAVAISNADPLLNDMFRVAGYIRVFRTLGIVTFMIVLTTSALVISTGLGSLFIGVLGFSYLYTMFDSVLSHRKLREVPFFRRLLTHRARRDSLT